MNLAESVSVLSACIALRNDTDFSKDKEVGASAEPKDLSPGSAFISEDSFSLKEIPKNFYVAFPLGPDSKHFGTHLPEYFRKESAAVMAALKKGKLSGITGVSDSGEIKFEWLGMGDRNAFLKMDGQALVKANKISRIMYDNPDYLASNGLSALFRLTMTDHGDYKQILTKLDEYLKYGAKKAATSPDFLYALDYTGIPYNLKVGTQLKRVKDVGSFAKALHAMMSKYAKSEKSSRWIAAMEKTDVAQLAKILRSALVKFGKTFTDEGEWIVKNKDLTIPTGSTLFLVSPRTGAEMASGKRRDDLSGADGITKAEVLKRVKAGESPRDILDARKSQGINDSFNVGAAVIQIALDWLYIEFLKEIPSSFKVVSLDAAKWDAAKRKYLKTKYAPKSESVTPELTVLTEGNRLPRGECYKYSLQWWMDFGDNPVKDTDGDSPKGAALVHGWPQTKTFATCGESGHAWLEKGGFVYDPSMKPVAKVPIAAYYALGKINPKHSTYYKDRTKTLALMTRHMHYGPWTNKPSGWKVQESEMKNNNIMAAAIAVQSSLTESVIAESDTVSLAEATVELPTPEGIDVEAWETKFRDKYAKAVEALQKVGWKFGGFDTKSPFGEYFKNIKTKEGYKIDRVGIGNNSPDDLLSVAKHWKLVVEIVKKLDNEIDPFYSSISDRLKPIWKTKNGRGSAYGIIAAILRGQGKRIHSESLDESESTVITTLRDIVANSQYKKFKDPVTGKMVRVDLFTASVILAVYDKLNAMNQKKLLSVPITQMSKIAYSVAGKHQKTTSESTEGGTVVEGKQKLMTAQARKLLPKLNSQEDVSDPIVYVKFFNAYGAGTWLITEFDGRDEMFGYVMGLGHNEFGYISLKELESLARDGERSLLQAIERDTSFKPMPLSKAVRKEGGSWKAESVEVVDEAKKINFDREVWEGWTVGDFIKELELAWKYKKWNNPTKPEMAKWLSSEQPSYKKRIPEVVAYFWDKYQKQKNESVDEELTTDELRREYRGRFAEVDGTAVRIDSKEGVASLVDNTGENALEEAFVPGIAWTQDAELKSLIKVGLRAKAADGAAKNRKLFKTFEKAFFDKPHPQGLKVMEMLFNIAKSLDSNDAPTTVPMFKTLQQRLKLMQTAERATGGGKTEALTTDELRREYRGRYAEVDGTAVRIDSKEGVASLVDNTGEELLELEWAELHACACERKKEVEGKTITLDIPAAITRKATTRIKRPVDVGPGSLDKDLPESIEESRKITPLNNDYRKAVLLISTLQGKLTTDGYTLLGAIGTDTKLTAAHMRKAKLDGPAFKAAVSDLQKHTVLSLVGKSVFPEITAAFKAMGAGPPKEEDTDV